MISVGRRCAVHTKVNTSSYTHFEWDGAKNRRNLKQHGLSMKRKADTKLKRLAAQQDEDIDLSDIPELDEAFFKEAEWHPPIKKPVTIRLDADVLEWFRGQGAGYQTRINRLLRRYMEVQQRRR